jgi:eukaryotic-like serine/threonine-protein kinase
MTLEKPASTASKLGTYDLLKEQPGIGVGSTWIARSAGESGDSPALFSVIRVHKHLTKKPETAPAVVADAEPARGFQHPNAAGLVDAATENGELYVVSEHHHGETLAALLTAAGAAGLAQPVLLRIALDVLAGLGAAHAHEPHLTHGELGPHQIVVADDGVSRVTGLVSARALSRVTPPIGAKNHDRLAYAAPERVKTLSATTPSAAEPQADVFSVGVILWEGISRQRLFTSKIEAAIIQKVLTAPIAALGTLAGVTVEAPLAEAVQRALDRDPAKRTQTTGELAAAIEALGADAVATPAQVAAEVERLAGKAITARKAEVRAELARRSNKGSTIPPPAAIRPGAPAPRKTTLLGIPAVRAGVPPSEGGVKVPAAAPVPVIAPAPLEPKPVFRPPAESLDLEDI